MRDREAALQLSISAAEEVGGHLAEYDTEAARALLDECEEGAGLPPRLRDALLRLVANLQTYRPYRGVSRKWRSRRRCQDPGRSVIIATRS
eukprot:gene15011-biopygen10497